MANPTGVTRPSVAGISPRTESDDDHTRLRIAMNLLTDDPRQPSGAHWCWTRIVPEMADRLLPGEELHLMLSPSARRYFPDHGHGIHHITYPWSNEHRVLRTASEHVYSPIRLPLSHIDLLSTAIAPLVNPTRTLVIHMKTMHAFSAPESLSIGARAYRRLNYQRSVRRADAIVVNSNSLRAEVDRYLEVDPQRSASFTKRSTMTSLNPGAGMPLGRTSPRLGSHDRSCCSSHPSGAIRTAMGSCMRGGWRGTSSRAANSSSLEPSGTNSTPPSCTSWWTSSASRAMSSS